MANISVEQNTRQYITYIITDESDNPINLEGADEARLRVANQLQSTDFEIDVAADSKNSDGEAVWELSNSQTDLRTGLYYFEVEIVYGSDNSTIPVVGRFFVKKRVTG